MLLLSGSHYVTVRVAAAGEGLHSLTDLVVYTLCSLIFTVNCLIFLVFRSQVMFKCL